jgi:excisionase family DNA binding protein
MPPSPASTQPASRSRPARDKLSLGPASRLIGVDPDTLRRWSDEGRMPTLVTPGGHRRFDRSDLERVLASRSHPTVRSRRPLAALGATPDRMGRAYARSYRPSGERRGAVAESLDASAREAFRADGRRLLGSLVAYLDAASTAGRHAAETEAIEAVRATGLRLAAAGAGLDEAAAAFISARRPFLAEIAGLGRRRSLDVASLTALYDEAVALLDRLLLEFLAAFNTRQGVPR